MKNSQLWKEIWEEFDAWYKRAESNDRCNKCGHSQGYSPDWEDQKRAITRIVSKRYARRTA